MDPRSASRGSSRRLGDHLVADTIGLLARLLPARPRASRPRRRPALTKTCRMWATAPRCMTNTSSRSRSVCCIPSGSSRCRPRGSEAACHVQTDGGPVRGVHCTLRRALLAAARSFPLQGMPTPWFAARQPPRCSLPARRAPVPIRPRDPAASTQRLSPPLDRTALTLDHAPRSHRRGRRGLAEGADGILRQAAVLSRQPPGLVQQQPPPPLPPQRTAARPVALPAGPAEPRPLPRARRSTRTTTA